MEDPNGATSPDEGNVKAAPNCTPEVDRANIVLEAAGLPMHSDPLPEDSVHVTNIREVRLSTARAGRST